MASKRTKKNKETPSGAAVIYARFSSHNQRDVSIEQQVKACTQYAERTNLQIVHIYEDKAVSGKTDRRPGFQRMMKDAESGKFQYVIAWKSNRMGRNMLQAMVNEARLNDLDIRCLYVEEDFDDTAAGRFALRNMMNVNQFYSENMAEDIRRGMMDNAEKCMINNGGIAFGYKKGPDGKYAIDEPKAEIVREIFTRYYNGDSFTDIINDLNGRGLKTSRGNLWNKNSLPRILSNERYIGVYEFSTVRIENGIPPIIEKELFYAVQEKLKNKKNPRGRHRESGDYLLTGKLYCGHCGSFMTGISGTSHTGKKHHYYICQKKRNQKDCDKQTVSRDWIEQKVAEVTQQYIMRDEVIRWISDGYEEFIKQQKQDSALKIAQEELLTVERSIKNIMSAIEQGIFTASTRTRLMELEAEQKRLEQLIAVEKKVQNTLSKEQIEFWLESFRDGKVTDKKYQAKLIDIFIQAVYLYDDHIRYVFNYGGKNNSTSISFSEINAIEHSPTAHGSFNLPLAPPAACRRGQNANPPLWVGVFFVLFSESSPATVGCLFPVPRGAMMNMR